MCTRPIHEQFRPFVEELQESFWGDLPGQTRAAWKKLFELVRNECGTATRGTATDAARGKGEDNATATTRGILPPFGTMRLRIARARGKSFLPKGIGRFQRQAAGAGDAGARSVPARHFHVPSLVVVTTLRGEPMSAQSVSRLTRNLGEAVCQFDQAPLREAYLFMDEVSLRARRP